MTDPQPPLSPASADPELSVGAWVPCLPVLTCIPIMPAIQVFLVGTSQYASLRFAPGVLEMNHSVY